MLSFSSVPSLSVKLKQPKCGPCNEHNHPLWVTSTPSPPSLPDTLVYAPLPTALVEGGKQQ